MDYEKKIREYMNSSKLYKDILSILFPELTEFEPKFKVGDWIEYVGERKEFDEDKYIIKSICDGIYITTLDKKIPFKFQDNYRLIEKIKQTPSIVDIDKMVEEWKQKTRFYSTSDILAYRQGLTDAMMLNNTIHTIPNKVEPKFKVGDWVVYVCGEETATLQISRIIKRTYEFTDGSSLNVADEDTLHLWTIKDTKEGDVLVDICDDFVNPLIFILKKFEHVNFGLAKLSDYSSYCYLTMGVNQKFKEGSYHHMHNIHPATKEQRDTLMKAMTDAGWEFDFEKKELKKNEQKSVEENKGNLGGISSNSEWSDEDEDILNEVIRHFDGIPLKHPMHKVIGWLVFIKQRIKH